MVCLSSRVVVDPHSRTTPRCRTFAAHAGANSSTCTARLPEGMRAGAKPLMVARWWRPRVDQRAVWTFGAGISSSDGDAQPGQVFDEPPDGRLADRTSFSGSQGRRGKPADMHIMGHSAGRRIPVRGGRYPLSQAKD